MSSDREEPISEHMESSPNKDVDEVEGFLAMAIVCAFLCVVGYFGYISTNNPDAALATSVAFGLVAVCLSLLYVGLQIRNLAR
ncbi:MAG: hypothetical protein ACFFFC_02600 [Candidatus Thorarchaeota archaeon]